jgi:hypothetical protein
MWQTRLSIALIVCALSQPVVASQLPDPARAKGAYARAIELEAEANHTAALSLLWEAAALAPHDADVAEPPG